MLLIRNRLAAMVAVSVVGVVAGVIALAGPLNPPAGAVSSTYKTLTEVEPRIAINSTNTPGNASATYRITQPGSYYLTGNVSGQSGKSGISIESGNVTLDLCGFSIIGVSGSIDGITMPAFAESVVIRNGIVSAWGRHGVRTLIDVGRVEGITVTRNGGWGIDNQSQPTFSTHLSHCEAFGNGAIVASTGGIRVGESALVTDSLARGNTGHGFATAGGYVRFVGCASMDCTADGFNSTGIETSLTNCTVGYAAVVAVRLGDRGSLVDCTISQPSGSGVILGSLARMAGCNVRSVGAAITALDDGVFIECSVTSSVGVGVSARDGNHFSNCRVSGCLGDGFNVRFGNHFEGCQARSNQGDGIESSSGGHILNCQLDGNGSGATVGANIRITGDACRIEGNSLIGADFGIQTTSGGNVIVRNSSRNSANSYGGISAGNDVGPIGSAATATSPWANIQY